MVFCGQCNKEFDTWKDELDHTCKITGVKPTDPESMGVNWQKLQENALKRSVKESDEKKLEEALQKINDRAVLKLGKYVK